jgi:cell wall-associated NlpC family hydrolase
MPISLLADGGGLSPFITDYARNQQKIAQAKTPGLAPPAIGRFGGFDLSAPQASTLKFGGDTVSVPTVPTGSFGSMSQDVSPALVASQLAPNPGSRVTGFDSLAFSTSAPGRDVPFRMSDLFPQTTSSTSPQGASLGGDWAGVDQWNAQIQSAASATGVDANLIKAVMKLESNGDPNAAGASGVWGPMQVNANAWGNGPWMTDPSANILKGAQILKSNLDQYGGDTRMALRAYHGFGSDGYTTDQQYADVVLGNLTQLQSARNSGLSTTTPTGAVGANNPAGLSVLNIALSYVGKAPYIWGSIPGKGANPAQTGWDCSGMTYWLDQNYGNGQLPMGSHYQYQYAQQSGKLFTNTGQLQAGDLVFIDTGWMGGAGSDLNRAGHVAVYLGNGKIVQAANENQGTIVSDLSSYTSGQYGSFLGGMHMAWSGGSGGSPGMPTGGAYRPFSSYGDPHDAARSLFG